MYNFKSYITSQEEFTSDNDNTEAIQLLWLMLVLEIILGDGQSTEASYITDINCFSVMQMI